MKNICVLFLIMLLGMSYVNMVAAVVYGNEQTDELHEFTVVIGTQI